jgi:cytochrome oxidase Cu insertion factor (SCO1/SenC/PrrC family)
MAPFGIKVSMPGKMLALLLLFLNLSFVVSGCGNGQEGEALSEGEVAPDFTLPAAQGGSVTLSTLLKDKAVLLYFNMADG